MLTIKEKKEIFTNYFIDKKSERYIALELGKSRTTIRKYIKEMRENIINNNLSREDLLNNIDKIVTEPTISKRTRYPKISEKDIEEIRLLFENNDRKRILGEEYLSTSKLYNIHINRGYRITLNQFYNVIYNLKNNVYENRRLRDLLD